MKHRTMEQARAAMSDDPDIVHNMMQGLWSRYFDGDELFECERYYTMDPMTYKLLQHSSRANQDGSLAYFERPTHLPHPENGEAPLRWRNIRIMLLTILPPVELAELCGDTQPDEIYYAPFCLYMTIVKKNGRLVYLDNEQTEPQYL